jgi:hypothetical protein
MAFEKVCIIRFWILDFGLMDRKTLEAFLLPLYQDVDGVSRFDDVERVGKIARRLYEPTSQENQQAFELLILFHALGNWLEKVGNISRTALAVGLAESDLRRTALSIRRLDNPQSDAERAVAAAVLIDRAGVRGLAERFASARREGQSLLEVVREEVASAWVPEWMPESGRSWLERRFEKRRRVCREILEELDETRIQNPKSKI